MCHLCRGCSSDLTVFAVPFLSGLSSSKVGGGFGDGVDTATVAVINEICERALLSDVAAAIAAARAIAGTASHVTFSNTWAHISIG